MIEHCKKDYTYDEALKLKTSAGIPIAKVHDARTPSMCFKFDTVEQAGGFAKDVLLGADPKDIFKAEKSFMNPRDADNLTKDYSEKCIIL
ncbi:hypothetical protein VTP01DRAFT_10798 [Rhizomucor pusillus]|uniref:uncharacterized protein n=1 Tax=Rhizomucor pusillus TaxID=4840 RepID=UPI0037431B8E